MLLYLSVPSLIIHAIDDASLPIKNARKLAEKLKNNLLIEVEGGHLMIGSEEKVKIYIDSFIVSS